MAVDNLVEVTKLRKEFGGLVATDDVDFTIPRGRIVALIGPNGAGKTTFFNQLTGVYKPTSGSIVFDGTEVVNMPPHAITALGIGRTFQNIRLFSQMSAVENVDFVVPRGSITSLIGPNGAGKTTFFNMLTGAYKPTAGEIVFDGQDIAGLPQHQITALGIGRTFQNIRLFGTMTSLENTLVGMHCRMHAGIFRSIARSPLQRREEAASREKARALLDYCGLPKRAEHEYARNLAYGDQRRLEVARALATEPKLLLLDEPTAGMNPQETAAFTAFVRKMRDERSLTVLLIEHDMRVVLGVSERVTVLDHGEKIAEGAPTDVTANERVREAYLGTRSSA